MKGAAWLMCWPLLGLLWFSATGADMLSDVTDSLDVSLDRLLDYVERDA
jgi:hypothetical protein